VCLGYHSVCSRNTFVLKHDFVIAMKQTHIKGNQHAILSSSNLRYDALEYATAKDALTKEAN
jgi:hypothetical protein